MSTLPVLYPENEFGPGRLTQMIKIRCSSSNISSLISILEKSARQVLQAPTIQDAQITVIIIDWGSEDEKNSVEQKAEYKKLTEGAETMSMEFDGSLEKTPKTGWYSYSHMKTLKEKQPALTAMLDAYLRSIFHCGKFKPVFHHVTMSKEDPEVMISFQGWPTKEQGIEYWESKIHKDVFPAVVDLTTIPLFWEAELR